MKLSPHCLTPPIKKSGIRSLVGIEEVVPPRSHPVALPPLSNFGRLALKLFRGEPAIAEFD